MKIKNDISKTEKLQSENQKKNSKSKNVQKMFKCPKRITESALVAVMHVLNDPLHWMIIEDENQKWNLKFPKLKSWSIKVEVRKSKK